MDFILNSLEDRTSCPVRKISIPYPFAAEQEVFVPVLRSFFGFYGQKPEALVPANHWIAFIIAEITLNFQEVAPPLLHTTCFSCVHFVVRKNNRPLQVKLENGRSGIQDDFQTRKHIEKLHSTRKQGRRIYNVCICKQCVCLYKHHLRCKTLVGEHPNP